MSAIDTSSNCCSKAFDISNRYHDQVNEFKNTYCVDFYKNHPIGARAVFMTAALIRGLVKPLFFLLEALVAAIYLPLKGAYLGLKEREGTVDYIKAGALNLLGVVSVGAFFVVAAYYLPLAASASIYMAATVFCIVVHIKRAAEDPESDGGSGPGAGIDGTPGPARSGRGSGDKGDELDVVTHGGDDLDPALPQRVLHSSSPRPQTLLHASPGVPSQPPGTGAPLLDALMSSPAVVSSGFTPARPAASPAGK